MRSKKLLAVLLLMCVILLVKRSAIADSITFNDAFNDVTTELIDQELRVSLFDGSLGTLDSVFVSMSGSLQSDGNVENAFDQPQSFTVSTRAQLYNGYLATGSPSVLPSPVEIFSAFQLIGEQTYSNMSGIESFGPVSVSSGPIAVFSSSNPVDLTQFTSPGLFGYNMNSQILTIIQGGSGNVATSVNTYASASLSVTYNFTEGSSPGTPVPEPATMLLLGTGLVGLVGARFRNKNR